MHTIKGQCGGTLIIVAICLAFFGSIGFLVLKLAPIYIEHFGVTSSLASMEQDRLHGRSVAELKVLLDKRLKINDVRRVSSADAKIKPMTRRTTIHMAYEVQVPLFSNVDLLVSFNDEAVLK